MTYRNPPLLEAVCDFGFGPKAQWDSRMIGLLSAQFSAYPKLQEVQQIEFGFGPGGVQLASEVPSTRSRLWAESDDRLVQVGPRHLSVNRLQPYGSWEAYRKQIVEALDTYMEVTHAERVELLGLTYVNQIDVPTTEVDADGALGLDLFFSFRPEYSSFEASAIETTASVSFLNEELPEAPVRYDIHLRSLPAVEPLFRFQLVLTARSARPMLAPRDEALEWLDRTHTQIETYFEAAIRPRLRDLFAPLPPR